MRSSENPCKRSPRLHPRRLAWCFVPLLLLLAASTAAALDTIDLTDTEISRAVDEDLMFDEVVASTAIDVSTTEGIVTLTGTVDSILARQRAVDLAERVKGVRSIVDRLVVDPELMPDGVLEDDIRRALVADPVADSWEIGVESEEGRVTLSGQVDSWAERALCEVAAKSVRGVRSVENDITVLYREKRHDAEIGSEVERRLERDVWVDDILVGVTVHDSQVSLEGTVGSLAEKNRAQDLSWVGGVREVDATKLYVDWWAYESERRNLPRQRPDDEEIKRAVIDALFYDPRVRSDNPDVEVVDGVVTLRGTVKDLRARLAAERDAENTFGVWRVKNHLKVRSPVVWTDATVARRVREALDRHALVTDEGISVTVDDGRVLLSGTTLTGYERRAAERAAADVQGATDVINRIVVDRESPQYLSDWEIREDIERELFWSPWVDADEVEVDVTGGRAILTGTVDSVRERRAAVENAFEGGAREVANHLQIENDSRDFSTLYYFPYYPFFS